MRTLFLSVFVFVFFAKAEAQLHTSKSVSMNVDFDAGGHFTQYKASYQGVQQPTDSSGAGTTLFRLNPQIHIISWLSAGIDIRWGGYIENPDNAEAAGNRITTTSVFVRAYPVNKDKFSWYVGAGIGNSSLAIKRRTTLIIPILYEYRFRGLQSFLETGINAMATKNIGFNFNLGYMGTNMKLRKFVVNGEKQNISDWNNFLNTKGITFGLGLTFAFLNN
jgi:hypothetical protein